MDYKKVLKLSITAGERLLFNGSATYRIEKEINKVLSVCPFTNKEVFVTTSGIVVTVDSPESGLLTMVKHVTKKGMNTERIAIIDITVEVENVNELNKAQKVLRKVNSVYDVRRKEEK